MIIVSHRSAPIETGIHEEDLADVDDVFDDAECEMLAREADALAHDDAWDSVSQERRERRVRRSRRGMDEYVKAFE